MNYHNPYDLTIQNAYLSIFIYNLPEVIAKKRR